MIRVSSLETTLEATGAEVSRKIALSIADAIDAGSLPIPETTITDVAVRTAWSIGLETGLTIAEIDRIGATELLEAISVYVQQGDPRALASSREVAVAILEGVLR